MWLDLLIGLESTKSDFQSQRFEWNASVLRMRSLLNMGLSYFRGLVLGDGGQTQGYIAGCNGYILSLNHLPPAIAFAFLFPPHSVWNVSTSVWTWVCPWFSLSWFQTKLGYRFEVFPLSFIQSLLVNFEALERAGRVLAYVYHVGGPGLNLEQQMEAVDFKLLGYSLKKNTLLLHMEIRMIGQ